MTFTRQVLLSLVASAAILAPSSVLAATYPPVRPPRSVGLPQLNLQVLLDRAGFSPAVGLAGLVTKRTSVVFEE